MDDRSGARALLVELARTELSDRQLADLLGLVLDLLPPDVRARLVLEAMVPKNVPEQRSDAGLERWARTRCHPVTSERGPGSARSC